MINMIRIVLYSALMASVLSSDFASFEKLSIEILDDVGYENCNKTLTNLEVRYICLLFYRK